MRARPPCQQLPALCHGQRCCCALKKEHLDPVPESDPAEIIAAVSNDARKPKLTSAQSEGSLTVFSNGHHKPAHKHNHLAHNCAPYKIPKHHPVQGSSDIARRSVDSLPATNVVEGVGSSPISDSIISAQQEVRLIKSEHTSPEIRPASNFDQQNGQLQPLDLSLPDIDAFQLDNTCATSYDYWSPDTDLPIFSAGLTMPSTDWSTPDLPLDDNEFDPTTARPPYVFDYNSLVQPALTNSSSGEPSEVDDFVPVSDTISYGPPSLVHNSDSSESYEGGETESYRLSTTSSFMGLQASLLSSNNLESLDIDEFLKNAAAGTTGFRESDTGGEISNNEAVDDNNYQFNETKKLAVDDQTDDVDLDLPLATNDGEDLWLTQMNPTLEDEVPESAWS
ncbi:hypothetical protein GP486_006546 [Trichoglossum hirsutum]|uniref:Uncharacterized protein n=1 Tax=Trichoglossum hirsutum TaxID=265104 RepID=A0A9P8IGS2_9PEZI|nr:hypothetical protein GP486_006546 [Trichoglossum hirsutum]